MTVNGKETDRTGADVPVLIIGAGPTGLVLALWLARLGVRFRIIDKTAEPGTTSRAMGVQARTLEFYRQAGFADEVVQRGVQVAGFNLWGRGTKVVRLPFHQVGQGQSPFPYLLDFPQDAHERLLIEQLEAAGQKVERRTELVRFEPGAEGVRATLRRPDGSEETCEAAYLAGADGAHSMVRAGLGIHLPGGTYQGLFYVADVEAEGPSIDHEVHADLDDGDFLGIFPMKGQGPVRLIGTVHQIDGREPREITFEDVRGRAVEHMKLKIDRVNWFSTYHVQHRVADHFRKGRAFLLGDAAHLHSPVGGQGMNTGIGDAVNLAWKLAAVLNDGAPESLLDTFETERIGFARRLVATTDRIFMLITREGRAAEFVRLKVFPRVVSWFFKSNTMRRFAFRTVSQIGIHYRESSLSEGKANGLRGGDRLPWVPLSRGVDNFDPLTSMAWQVHVYGEPSRGVKEAADRLGIPVHAFPWSPEMKPTGLSPAALYLIRPDGYIALADPQGDPERLGRYFATRGLSARSRPEEAVGIVQGPAGSSQ